MSVASSGGGSAAPEICRNFQNHGRCRFGDACRYLHVAAARGDRQDSSSASASVAPTVRRTSSRLLAGPEDPRAPKHIMLYNIDAAQAARLAAAFPGRRFFAPRPGHAQAHGHPVLATQRAITEEIAYNLLNGERLAPIGRVASHPAAPADAASDVDDAEDSDDGGSDYGDDPPDPRRGGGGRGPPSDDEAKYDDDAPVDGAPPRVDWVFDIGAGAGTNRHRRRNRLRVWCNNPQILASDANWFAKARARIPAADQKWCTSTAQECMRDHVGPALHYAAPGYGQHRGPLEHCTRGSGLSVHSLYYLPAPGTADGCVIDIVFSFARRHLVAVVHLFDDAVGSLAGGEATYRMHHNGFVTMQVNGNVESYHHDALSWMRRTNMASKRVNGHKHSITWRRVSTHGDSHIYEFRGHVDSPAEPNPCGLTTYSAVLGDSSYYGPVDPAPGINGVGRVVDADRQVVADPMALAVVTENKLFSVGRFLVAGYDQNREVPVPKGILRELTVFMVGRDHNADTWKALTEKAKMLATRVVMPGELTADGITLAAAMAFTAQVSSDASYLRNHVAPRMRAAKYTDWLRAQILGNPAGGGPAIPLSTIVAVSVLLTGGAALHLRGKYAREQLRLLARVAAAEAKLASRSEAPTVRGAFAAFRAAMAAKVPRIEVRVESGPSETIDPFGPDPDQPGVGPAPASVFGVGLPRPFARIPNSRTARAYRAAAQVWLSAFGERALLDGQTAIRLLTDPLVTVFQDAVLAPVLEETLRRYGIEPAVAFLIALCDSTGLPQHELTSHAIKAAGAAAFWAVENVIQRRGIADQPMRLVAHLAFSLLPVRLAVPAHACYNAYALLSNAAAIGSMIVSLKMEPSVILARANSKPDPAAAIAHAAGGRATASLGLAALVAAAAAALWWFIRRRRKRARGPATASVLAGLFGTRHGPVAVYTTRTPAQFEAYSRDRSTPSEHGRAVYHHERYPWLPMTVTRARRKPMSQGSSYRDAGAVPNPNKPKFVAAGLTSLVSIPVVYAPHPHNSEIAFCNRQAVMHPNQAAQLYPKVDAAGEQVGARHGDPQWLDHDPHEIGRFRAFKKAYHELLYPEILDDSYDATDVGFQRIKFSEWLSRFPAGKRTALLRAWQAVHDGSYDRRRMGVSSAFSKVETQLKSTPAGLELGDPRLILSSSDENKVAAGPAAYSTSKLRAVSWSPRTRHFLLYASGVTAEQLGEYRAYMLDRVPYGVTIESDGERYDSTINVSLKESQMDTYRRFGWDATEIGALASLRDTRGRTKDGSRFKCSGATQSGIVITTDGNSDTNGTSTIFVALRTAGLLEDRHFARRGNHVPHLESAARRHPQPDPNMPAYVMSERAPSAAVLRQALDGHFVALVGGDDELEDISDVFLARYGGQNRADKIAAYCEAKRVAMLRLGPRLAMVVHDGTDREQASFYSGLFYPTERGLVYGPMPFRSLAKAGYYANAWAEFQGRNEKYLPGLVLADAKGRLCATGHVPILREYFERVLALTEEAQPVGRARLERALGDPDKRVAAQERLEPNEATHEFMRARYSFYSKEWLEGLVELWARVGRLPASYAYPGLAEGLQRDTGLLVAA